MPEPGSRAIAATLISIAAWALLVLGLWLKRRGVITLEWEVAFGTTLGLIGALASGLEEGAAEAAIGFVVGFLIGFDATLLVHLGGRGTRGLLTSEPRYIGGER